MKRSITIDKLIKEGFSEKFLSKLSDKHITELSERVLSENTLNIPKDDQAAIDQAKNTKQTFVTYEEEEVDESSAQQAAIAINMKKKGKKPKNEVDEQEEINEWVDGLVKTQYHPMVTTKKEIYEMIGSLSDSADNLADAKNMFSVDENQPSPSKPERDTPVREKPDTKPNRPQREDPFNPRPSVNPKPKANLPKSLSWSSLGIELS
jgi:hypothetical protein